MLMLLGGTPYHEKKRAKLKLFRQRLAAPLGYISQKLEQHLEEQEKARQQKKKYHSMEMQPAVTSNPKEVRESFEKKLEPYVCIFTIYCNF